MSDLAVTIAHAAAKAAEDALQYEAATVSRYSKNGYTARCHREVGGNTLETGELEVLAPGGVRRGLKKGEPVWIVSLDLDGKRQFVLPGRSTDKFKPSKVPEGQIWIVDTPGKDLGDDDAVVRMSDFKKLVSYINNTLLPALKLHGHPPPGAGPPINVAQFTQAPDATASKVVKVE